jgi:hypothetical protein
MIVKLQQRTISVNAADAKNAEVQTELRNKVQRGFADNPTVTANSPPARMTRKSSFSAACSPR